MSIHTIIIIQNNKPFWKQVDNKIETLNEIVVVLICYNLMVVTDFVMPIFADVKKGNGYVIIALIVLVVLLYLAFIIYGMIMLIASKVYRFY